MAGNDIKARVKALSWECPDVLKVTLIPLGGEFPAAEPGAHVDVKIPGAPVRQYSLTMGSSTRSYIFGVRLDPKTRGGSRAIHTKLRPGDLIEISQPRNAFPLVADGPVHLVAGGIGITPILFMAEELSKRGQPWSLSYFVRSQEYAAFADEVLSLGGKIYCDDVDGQPNMSSEVEGLSPDTHLYCCGPAPMLDAFVDACKARAEEFVHIERFAAAPINSSAGGFVVELKRSGLELAIPADRSILETLIEAGLEPSHNCRAGICGECEVKVLEGSVDHQDMILSDDEKASGAMLICCSRSASDRLVIDL